ncbi:hypothetical protein GIB67_022236, partial [Kingdonia uniflora]
MDGDAGDGDVNSEAGEGEPIIGDDMHGDDMNGDAKNIEIDEENNNENIVLMVEEWIQFAQLNVDSLDAESGYYHTHNSQDGDYIPSAEDFRRCGEFEELIRESKNIFQVEEEEAYKKQPQSGYEKLVLGMEWPTIDEARKYLRKLVIINKLCFLSVKNVSYRLKFKCEEEECTWYVYVRRTNDGHTMILRGGNFDHSCSGKRDYENRLANAQWVANDCEEMVRDRKIVIPDDIITRIRREYGVNISYYTAWNAKKNCVERITGCFDEGYSIMQKLCRQVLLSNPGRCRPIVGLYGCFLEGKYGGQCLAILRDKPLHKFIEGMNLMIMKLTYDRRKKAENWNVNSVVPIAKTYIEEMKYCNQYTPQGADANKWVAISKDGFVVNIIWWLHIEDLIKGPNNDMLPPPLERGTGRPTKVRRRSADENTTQQEKKCGKCGFFGHNKKTCKGPPAAPRPKNSQPTTRTDRRGGRPRGSRPKKNPPTRVGVGIGVGIGVGVGIRGRGTRGGVTRGGGGGAARVHTQASQQSTNNTRGGITRGRVARFHSQASQQSTNNAKGGLTRGGTLFSQPSQGSGITQASKNDGNGYFGKVPFSYYLFFRIIMVTLDDNGHSGNVNADMDYSANMYYDEDEEDDPEMDGEKKDGSDEDEGSDDDGGDGWEAGDEDEGSDDDDGGDMAR